MRRRKILLAVAGAFVLVAVPLLTIYLAFPRTLLKAVVLYQRSAAGFERRSVQIQDWSVPYIDSGREVRPGKETILFVHGFGETKDRFVSLAGGLTGDYRVVALDLPGFGESEIRMDENYSPDFYVHVILAFVDELRLDSVHLVGYSMGGMFAAKVASQAPDRVRSLTLLAPAGLQGDQPSEVDRIVAEGLDIPLVYRDRKAFDRLLRLNFNQSLDLPGFAVRALVAEGKERADLHEKIFRQTLVPAETEAFVDDIAALRARTLVIWGTSDQILDASAADRWSETNPGIRVIKLPDVGHALIYQQVHRIRRELRSHCADSTTQHAPLPPTL